MKAENVIQQVASIYGVSVEDVLSRKRHRIFADCRTVICYILRSVYGMSTKDVGRLLGRTHVDVVYHTSKGEDWVYMPRLNPFGNTAILEVEFSEGRELVLMRSDGVSQQR